MKSMKYNKKGFTLIELMAVIMILVILGFITIPVIKELLLKARISTWKESINNIIGSADNYISKYTIMYGTAATYPIEFICDGKSCSTADGIALNFTGEVPKSGKIVIASEGNIYAELVTNDKWCASGTKGRLDAQDSCKKLDHTLPVLLNDEKIVIAATNNLINVIFPYDIMIDKDTGVTKYVVKLRKDGNILETREKEKVGLNVEVIFTNLESDSEYDVIITGVNGNNGETTINKKIKTKTRSNPIIVYENIPENAINGYLKKDIIEVKYNQNNNESEKYYLYSDLNLNLNNETLEVCEGIDNPIECKEEKTLSLEANKWYRVSNDVKASYEENSDEFGYVKTYVYNDEEVIGTSGAIVSKIDNESPALEIINTNVTSSDIIVSYNTSDSRSGLNKFTCKYGNNIDNYPYAVNSVTSNNCVIHDLKSDENYYYQVCAYDNLENEKCINGNIKTESSLNYEIEYKDEVESKNGYLPKQVIAIKSKNTNSYYIKSSKKTTLSKDTSKKCGVDYEPNNCQNENTKVLEQDTWYEVIGDINLEFIEDSNEYGTLIVADYKDKFNYSVSAVISKIESTKPSAPVIKSDIEKDAWTVNPQNVYLETAGEAYSGVKEYEYLIMSNDTTPTDSFAPNGTVINNLTVYDNGTNYIYFRTVSNASNVSDWSNPIIINLDNVAPEKTNIVYKKGFSGDAWQNDIEISLTASDNVGVKKYEVDINGDGVSDGETEANYIPLNGHSSINTKFRAVDNSGNIGPWSDEVRINIDTEKPNYVKYEVGEITKEKAIFYVNVTDNIGMMSPASTYAGHKSGTFCVVSTETGGYENWHWFSAEYDNNTGMYRCDITPSTFSHYGQSYLVHIYIYDYAGNGGYYDKTFISIP